MNRSGIGPWGRANLIFGAILLLIGLGLLVGAVSAASNDARLRAEGYAVTAAVVDAREVRRTRRGATVATEYEVKYRFVAGGSPAAGGSVVVSDWTGAPEAAVTEAARRRTIEISYLPSDPTINTPVAALAAGAGGVGFSLGQHALQLVVAALFAGVGGLVVASGRPTAEPARPAVAPGLPAGVVSGEPRQATRAAVTFGAHTSP